MTFDPVVHRVHTDGRIAHDGAGRARGPGPKSLARSDVRADDEVMTEGPHTCPYCELRFDYHNEVKDHILRDHPDHPAVALTAEIHEIPHI